MDRRRIRAFPIFLTALVLILASLACGRPATPTETPIVVVATPTPAPVAAQPTAPPEPTSTPQPDGCTNAMEFLADVTVPDGTTFAPDTAFVKTWRVRNTGTCDWSGYRIIFSDGEPMGTPEQVIADTSAGQEVEISLEMTAPGGPGNYTGRWQVQSPSGAVLGNLTCVIVVEGGDAPAEPPAEDPTEPPAEEPTDEPTEEPATEEPTAEPTDPPTEPETITLQSLPAEDGYVRGLTGGQSISLQGNVQAGDGTQDQAKQAFFSFDLSTIPAGATIESAMLDLGGHEVRGAPFPALGALRVYHHQYGTLDPSDFVTSFPTGFHEWSGPPETADATTQVQNAIANGRPRFKIRVQFNYLASPNQQADMLVFPEGGPSLTVMYTE